MKIVYSEDNTYGKISNVYIFDILTHEFYDKLIKILNKKVKK